MRGGATTEAGHVRAPWTALGLLRLVSAASLLSLGTATACRGEAQTRSIAEPGEGTERSVQDADAVVDGAAERSQDDHAVEVSAGGDGPPQTVSAADAKSSTPAALAGVEWPPVDESVRNAAALLAGRVGQGVVLEEKVAARVDRHGRLISKDWKYYVEHRREPLRTWAQAELKGKDVQTVLYPFAGADLPTALAFYPGASHYILVALQRAGAPPHLDELRGDETESVLAMHRELIDAYTHHGFFVTKHMNQYAKGGMSGPGRGLTAQLMILAELEGMDVQAVEPIRVSESGETLEIHPGDRNDPATWSSVRLYLHSRADDRRVLVDYVRGNLADGGLERQPELATWLAHASQTAVVIKAASHLMQTSSFSQIRDLLLEHATSIVQDETGIDVDRVRASFAVELYGEFRRVNPSFPASSQERLIEAYRTGAPKDLPVVIGYRKGAGSCLIVAQRLASPSATPAP